MIAIHVTFQLFLCFLQKIEFNRSETQQHYFHQHSRVVWRLFQWRTLTALSLSLSLSFFFSPFLSLSLIRRKEFIVGIDDLLSIVRIPSYERKRSVCVCERERKGNDDDDEEGHSEDAEEEKKNEKELLFRRGVDRMFLGLERGRGRKTRTDNSRTDLVYVFRTSGCERRKSSVLKERDRFTGEVEIRRRSGSNDGERRGGERGGIQYQEASASVRESLLSDMSSAVRSVARD